jgi:hypothetical protein
VNEVLHRPLYRGEIVWNRSRKRNRWGQHDQTARPEGEWLRLPAPELRIVSDVLWDNVHGRLASIRGRLQEATGAKLGARSRDIESRHLLPGFARCALCGGSLAALGRDHGQERVFFYGCLAHRKRGPRICGNNLELRVANIDEAVLRRLGGDVLRPAVVQAVIDGVFDAMQPDVVAGNVDRLHRELAAAERELANLARAIAAGGQLEPLLVELKACQARRDELTATIGANGSVGVRDSTEGSLRRPFASASRVGANC